MRRKRSVALLFFLQLLSLILRIPAEELAMARQIFHYRDTLLSQKSEETVHKACDLGGQIKLGHSLLAENEKAGLYQLNSCCQGENRSNSSDDQLRLKLWGNYDWGRSQFFGKINYSAHRTDLELERENSLEEAFITRHLNPEFRLLAGKKILSWGRGYAWKPLAFLDSSRDPLDPDLPHRGLIFLGAEYGREFPPGPDPLHEVTFTSVVFPVQEKINEGLGHLDHWNMASKLSLLFWNTEIDLVALKGKSRPERYGFDFSRKLNSSVDLNSSLELYGDFWVSPQYEKVFLDQDGKLWKTNYTAFGSLGGIRYERGDICWLVEYYRDKGGFNPQEMDSYYHYLQTVVDAYPQEGLDQAGQRMAILSRAYYQQPSLMQEYAYTQILKREPFRIQHLTCALAGVWNLQDRSFAFCPELRYDSKPNLNLGLKSTFWKGHPQTEFGEKLNYWAVEVSVTYYFEFSFYYLTPSYPEKPYQDSPGTWR